MQNWDSRKARAFLANSNHFRVPVPAPALRLSILPATHPPLRVALSHYAAGNFELARNSPDEVVEQYQATLNFAARDPNLLLANSLSLAYVHLVRSEYTTARIFGSRM